MAIQEVVMFVRALGFRKLEVESDSVSAVRLLKKESLSSRSVCSLISYIKSLVLDFSHISFDHVVRTCNRPAQLLANSPFGQFWFEL